MELREHHQRTLKDYARMEQRLENLQSELDMMRNQAKTYSSGSEFSQSSGFHTSTNSHLYLEDLSRSLPELHLSPPCSTPIPTSSHEVHSDGVIRDLNIKLKSLERQNMILLEENDQLKEEIKKMSIGRERYEREPAESKLNLAEELKSVKQRNPLVQVSSLKIM